MSARLACLLLVSWIAPLWAAPRVTLAIVNARVWTADSERPWAQAVAIAGDRILAVGTDAEIRALIPAEARVVDARCALVTPGFIDAHIHLYSLNRARLLPPLALRFVRTKEEAAHKIAAYAEHLPPGAWILGDDLPEWGAGINSRWLDALAPANPAWLVNRDGDAGVANTAALRAAGISPQSAPGGWIRGGAMWRIDAALMPPSGSPEDETLRRTLDSLVRAGVTSVHHNNGWPDFLMLERLRREGRLAVRVYAAPPLPAWRRLRDYIAEHGRGDAWLHWGAVKGFGKVDEASCYRWITGAAGAGLQVMVHAGDEELATLVSVYRRVTREQHLKDARFRIEHAHSPPPEVIPLLASLGVVASWQPPLVAHYAQRTAAGSPPPANLFPCRALLEAGVRIAFGTDAQAWSAGIVPPLESLRLALAQAAPDGTRLTLDQALRAHTIDAAYAEFRESEKGSIEAGKLADLVVLDRDSLPGAAVRVTVIGGEIRYDADAAIRSWTGRSPRGSAARRTQASSGRCTPPVRACRRTSSA